MSTENDNKDVVRAYLNDFNKRDGEALAEHLADDVVEHGIHEELHGPDEIVEYLDAHFEMFPDYSGTTDAIIADGDLVAVRYTVSGTHTGEYKDVEPTGHNAEWTGMAMYRVQDGTITEIWLEEDRLGLLDQLEEVDPEHAHFRI